ncbi:hypothetical protein HCA63_17020 [Listeria booriae]|uniref:hypothetical protein n=1 Tax=Listeria booriae TaxID=1552123 RepID=UPI001627A2D7|nr:hypothetical protein [Listeria booriae]MBC1890061.1 hypothetical protein [Listeria booriae]
MVGYQEEQMRKNAQRAFQRVISKDADKRLSNRVSIFIYDQAHTMTESLDMRLEAVTELQMRQDEPETNLAMYADYIAALVTLGSVEEQRYFLEHEKEVLDKIHHQLRPHSPVEGGKT